VSASSRWAIRVTYPSGEDAYLRHGATVGEGPVVTFRTKRDAELNAEAYVQPGLDEGTVVSVVKVRGVTVRCI
jgi:hypothetical protein